MELFQTLSDLGNRYIVELGISVGDETVPFMVILLLGAGVFLTLRLGFVQLRRLGHGFAVTSGKYDDPDEPGDVSHFQALTTALSATVGIGNIAGVAIAIHWGGPGALFWMWVTAALGMATKFTEVTLAQKYREVEAPDRDAHRWGRDGERAAPCTTSSVGWGARWKWMAVFFAITLGLTAFLTGTAIQANTVSDSMRTIFGIPTTVSGLVTSAIVALVILGGITRIGRVTGILAPLMAAIYCLGALVILFFNASEIIPALGLIFREAFNPTAGVAGTGVGAFLVTLMWGVRRGLFSNEAGQGSAPIAHAAAKTDEPVSEGVVALLEPFIDTIVIWLDDRTRDHHYGRLERPHSDGDHPGGRRPRLRDRGRHGQQRVIGRSGRNPRRERSSRGSGRRAHRLARRLRRDAVRGRGRTPRPSPEPSFPLKAWPEETMARVMRPSTARLSKAAHHSRWRASAGD